MTNAVPIRIADAVTAQINTAKDASAFGINDFTAVRSYADWDEKFEDLPEGTPQVDVVFMASTTPELEDVSALDYMVNVDIALRCRFAPSDRHSESGRLKNASIDPLVTLLEEIHEYFVALRNTTTLTNEPTASWQESDVKVWVDRKKLRAGLFYGWVRIAFSMSKDV